MSNGGGAERRGRFVVFEGGEGSGKSTQAARLAQAWGATLTRQPGGTAMGALVRSVLLDPATGDLDPKAEALLMAADRAQHVTEMIEPLLAAGVDVICDRYSGSQVAYQGYGRGLDPAEVARLSSWAAGGREPDVVVLLVVPPEVSAARLGGELDRFEAAGAEFHRRVVDGFLTQAADDPERWVVIDGTGTVDEVSARVDDAVERRWPVE